MGSRIQRILKKKATARTPRFRSTGYRVANEFYWMDTDEEVDVHRRLEVGNKMVPRTGIEPARLSTLDPKSSASANFATSAL